MAFHFSIRPLVILIAIIIFFIAYIRFIESRSVFFPHLAGSTTTPQVLGLRFEDVFFKTSDGLKLNGWFILGSESYDEKKTFLFFHGNAGTINDRIGKIALLHQLGVNIFIIDYRGYGKSEGRPSERGIYLDAWAAYDYLLGSKGIAPEDIIVYGVSLGGVPAVDLASTRQVGGLIVESTFTSAKDMAKKILPIAPSFLIRTKMNSIDKIKDVRAPKVIIHSPEDEMIPFEMGRRLYDAAPQPKEFLEIAGGHNEGYFTSEAEMLKGMKDFLLKYF